MSEAREELHEVLDKAIYEWNLHQPYESLSRYVLAALVARLSAALPVIEAELRETLAREIEAMGDTFPEPVSPDFHEAIRYSASIVRGGGGE